jgi:hypothetical protein
LCCQTWLSLVTRSPSTLVIPPGSSDQKTLFLVHMFPHSRTVRLPPTTSLTSEGFGHILSVLRSVEFDLSLITDHIEANQSGIMLHEMKKYNYAAAFFTRSIELKPTIVTLWYNRAAVCSITCKGLARSLIAFLPGPLLL